MKPDPRGLGGGTSLVSETDPPHQDVPQVSKSYFKLNFKHLRCNSAQGLAETRGLGKLGNI